MCILEEDKVCDNCCSCFVCELDPAKTCDNCAKCLELADYNDIPIDDIILPWNEKHGNEKHEHEKHEKVVKNNSG
ncbi:hypothetical protein A6M21_10840 [Desulfotomaculum copahuensis]|uniref:Uncharacterized protein n=2 Tax=Desulfotomaculum copahuensis TaxID=1838280 RepID=A0A1B7LEB9_9FIRM|nr:hypothetical protein A6M21_10840 [Desulfotomaculum copahuensis]